MTKTIPDYKVASITHLKYFICRSWNVAASDNKLWQSQHSIFFADSDNLYEIKILQTQTGQAETKLIYVQSDVNRVGFDWREVFKRDYKGKYTSI